MKNRSWKREKSRQDSQESTVSTQTSSSIREFELFQQFCSSSPTWEIPAETSEGPYMVWNSPSGNEVYPTCQKMMAAEEEAQFSSLENKSKEESECLRLDDSSLLADQTIAQTIEDTSLVHPPINNDTKGKTTAPSKNFISCRVILLDCNEYVVEIDKKSRGHVLVDKVCEHVNLLEKDYFSCSFRDVNDIRFWLISDKKIIKQVPDGVYTFAFEVKFYPPDPVTLQEDITRYQLCLQIQKDIISGRMPCSFVTYALLGSYVVQSELGDFCSDEHGHDVEYLRPFQFAPTQTDDLLEKIAELHRTHRGLTPAEADNLYLINASKLAMYGLELHSAKDSDGKAVMVGVCSSGLAVYQDKLRISRFIWPKMLKLSYKYCNFIINIRPNSMDQSESTISYKLPNHKMAKRLWRVAVEHHTFFRLKETEPVQRRLFRNFGSSKFQYEGRTHHQTCLAASQINRPAPSFSRIQYRSFTASQISDLTDGIRAQQGATSGGQEAEFGKRSTTAVEIHNKHHLQPSIKRDEDDMLDAAVVCDQFLHSSLDRDPKSSPNISCSSRLTASTHSQPGLPTTPSRLSTRSDAPMIKTQTRTVTLSAVGNHEEDEEDFGILVSSHCHSSRSHTIETTTYQTEKDGIIETRVEKKLMMMNMEGDDSNHDQILASAIQAVKSPDIAVEKIEIQTKTEHETD